MQGAAASLAGVRYDGALPLGQAVVVRPVDDAVEIVGAVTLQRFARASVRVDAPVPGVPARLCMPDGAVIEIGDAEGVAALWPPARGLSGLASRLERRWRGTLAVALLGAVAIAAIVTWLLPLAAAPVAASLSPALEREVGVRTLRAIDAVYAQHSRLDAEERHRATRVVRDVLGDDTRGAGYDVRFRRMGQPNAFALPGDIIVLTDELVRLVKSDDELAAVIAHEAGHLHAHHAVRMVLQQSGVAVLVTAVAGDAVGMTLLAAALPAMLLDTRYSRAFETEADDFAFARLARRGISPQAFADVMRRLDARAGSPGRGSAVPRYLASHPVTGERIQRAEAAARAR